MTVVSSIITDAFREGNILPLGKAPTSAQSTEALRLLNAILRAIYGDEAGENLEDWPLGTYGQTDPQLTETITDYFRSRPTLNSRLLALNEAAFTVYMPPFPQDGSRMGIADPYSRLAAYPVILDGNGRPIEGAATLTLNTNGLFQEWLYRADLGQWVKIQASADTDEMPFPDDFDNFFMTTLAMRINPRYGRQMDPQSQSVYASERKKFIARYLQALPLKIRDDISWPYMSKQSYDQQSAFGVTTTQGFDVGNPLG